MMRTRLIIVAVILATLVTGIAWHVAAQPAGPDVVKEGDIHLTDEMREWIESQKAIPGVHIGVFDGIRIVLIAAGEKPTAGYAVVIEGVSRDGQGWVIRTKNTGPGGGMVAQVITYPYALVGLKGDAQVPVRVN